MVLENGDFEHGDLSHWTDADEVYGATAVAESTAAYGPAYAHSGDYLLSQHVEADSGEYGEAIVYQGFDSDGFTNISFWYKVNQTDGTGYFEADIRVHDLDHALIWYSFFYTETPSGTAWTQYSVTYAELVTELGLQGYHLPEDGGSGIRFKTGLWRIA
jgi:hypothetical protein